MLKKAVIAILVLCVLFWGGLYVAVKIALPPDKVRSLVREHGSKALNRDIQVGGASVGVFPFLKVSLTDIVLANAEGFSDDPMFSIQDIRLAVDFLSVVKLSPVIKEIRLVEPDILYEVDKRGRTNLEGLGGEAKAEEKEETTPEEPGELPTALPAALSLKGFVIENARVRYRDMKTGTVLTLGSINQNVSVEVDKKLEDIQTKGKLLVSSISVSDKASGLRKGGVNVSLTHDIGVNLASQTISINALSFGLQDIAIDALGKVTQFMSGVPGIDIKLSSNQMKMASILKEVPAALSPEIPKLSAKGFAKLAVSVAGVLDTAGLPNIDAKLTFHDMGFGHTDVPAQLHSLNGLIHFTNKSLEIKNFGFKLDQHPVSLAMLVTDLLDVPVLQNLEVDSKIELGPLMDLAGKYGAVPAGFAMSGLVESNIKAKGKLDPGNPMGLKARGDIMLENVSVQSAELPDRALMNGKTSINNDVIKSRLAMKIGQSDLTVTARVANYLAMAMPELAKGKKTKAVIGITSSNLDLDQLLPQGPGEEEEEAETEPITAFPALPNVDVTVNFNLARTKLMDLEMAGFTQKLKVNNGLVDANLKGKLYSGGISGGMSVDLRDTTNAKVAMKFKVDRVEANDFISRINDKLPRGNGLVKVVANTDNTLYGKMTMVMDLKTHGLPHTFADNLTGTIDMKLHDGKLVGVKMVQGLNQSSAQFLGKFGLKKSFDLGNFVFSALKGILEAKDGGLLVKHLNLDNTPMGYLDLRGRFGFDTKLDLTLTNHLPRSLSKPVLAAQKKGRDAAAGLAGDVAGGLAAEAVGMAAAVPEDKSGRAIVYYNIGGTVDQPKFGIDYKRMQREAGAAASGKAKAALKAAADAKLKEAKARVEAEKKKALDAARKKEAELKAKAEAEKKKLEEKARKEAEKKKEEAKKETKKKAKKALKKLGF